MEVVNLKTSLLNLDRELKSTIKESKEKENIIKRKEKEIIELNYRMSVLSEKLKKNNK